MSEEQCKEIFNTFDVDGSGFISARELVNCLCKVFPDKDDTTIKAIAHTVLQQADKNDDDKITWDEFYATLQEQQS